MKQVMSRGRMTDASYKFRELYKNSENDKVSDCLSFDNTDYEKGKHCKVSRKNNVNSS